MDDRIMSYAKIVDDAVEKYIPASHGEVCDAMRYSISAGGKRIRPALLLEFCRVCGGNIDDAAELALAVEMIHTYSLIHDDLPCMDNDDLRRGKPSCHKQFGEATALLAGDALLTYAFSVIFSSPLDCDKKCRAAKYLADAAGFDGMIGGQILDLQNEKRLVDAQRLKETDLKKTGALIKAACVIGCIAGGADNAKIEAASIYAENLGLAFQIIDDILDVTADEKLLGKPVGSDKEQGKNTYVSLLGLENARELAKKLTQDAKTALDIFGSQADGLCSFADSLLKRSF